MNYAVMPLADYDAACDKVREKVGEQTILFEETDFGYLRSAIFTVAKTGRYLFSFEFSDPSKFSAVYYNFPEWEAESSPGSFEIVDTNNAKTTSNLYAGEQYRIFISDHLGLTPKDILKATLSIDGEVVVDFVPPLTIKSGEMADRVEDVYESGKEAEQERFWSNFFNGGVFGAMFAGGGWNVETFKPVYPAEKIKITTRNGGDRLFFYFNRPSSFATPLVDLSEFCEHIDFSDMPYADRVFNNARAKNITVDFGKCTSLDYAFASGNGGQLENVTVRVTETCIGYINPFFYQNEMKKLRFTEDSVIAANITFAQSSALTHDSLMSIINALKDYSDTTTTKTLTLHANSKAILTDAEKAIATEKGWTLA